MLAGISCAVATWMADPRFSVVKLGYARESHVHWSDACVSADALLSFQSFSACVCVCVWSPLLHFWTLKLYNMLRSNREHFAQILQNKNTYKRDAYACLRRHQDTYHNWRVCGSCSQLEGYQVSPWVGEIIESNSDSNCTPPTNMLNNWRYWLKVDKLVFLKGTQTKPPKIFLLFQVFKMFSQSIILFDKTFRKQRWEFNIISKQISGFHKKCFPW